MAHCVTTNVSSHFISSYKLYKYNMDNQEKLPADKGVKNILTDFMLIDEANLKDVRLKLSPEETTAEKLCMMHCGN
eukprot:219725-Ditylum_brightwellii.AAC.1